MTTPASIDNVSDTALWVATYRALETERPDALFRDPLARVLAGERGRAIAAAMPSSGLMAWVMALRTVAIDRLIQRAVELGIDTVLNLGAGLDTRPYRLTLPATLRWIEVDFPHLIAHKNETLRAERPVCRLERVALDLSDRPARQALFAKIGGESRRVLAITEGVIPYLTADQAAALADDLFAVPTIEGWVQDFHEGGLRGRRIPWAKKLKASPFLFDAKDWFGFFGAHGWQAEETYYVADLAQELKRPPPFVFPISLVWMLMPKVKRQKLRRASGYVRLKRSNVLSRSG